jgi:hypothetical protein
VTCVLWTLILVCLETVLVSVEDWCTVCNKRTIGSETVLDAFMVVLGDGAQVEAHFSPFRDSTNLDTR